MNEIETETNPETGQWIAFVMGKELYHKAPSLEGARAICMQINALIMMDDDDPDFVKNVWAIPRWVKSKIKDAADE